MKPVSRRRWFAIFVVTGVCAAGWFLYFGIQPRSRPTPSLRPSTISPGAHARRALLVGCGRYKNASIRPLEGPANDVRLMQEVLVRRCGFSPDEITTLVDAAPESDTPTRANIEREFRRLQASAGRDHQIVVLLSGHGSQQPNQANDSDDFEIDGLDEIFLPIDVEQWSSADSTSGSGGVVNAIVDDEIYRWTAAIAEKGATVWIIFDCCCAGAAVRGAYQEVPRFASPAGDLMVPKSTSPTSRGQPHSAAPQHDEAHWEALPSDRIVAFYACQSDESELELALPPATDTTNVERAKHGLLTYALCCALSEPAAETLTYRELAREIWLRYRSWGRASPTPFADGAVDRRVLGERQAGRRFRVVRRSDRDGVVDAGGLQGLTPGSILALYSSPAGVAGVDDQPHGYARVARVQPTSARIVPCIYGEARRGASIEVGAWCEMAYAVFGDMRLAVAIDQESSMRKGQTTATLAHLSGQLRGLADAPTSVFRIVDEPAEADWVIQNRGIAAELLPRSAAALAEGEPLPLGTPRFAIEEGDSVEAAVNLLQRIFRAQNLIKLAGGYGNSALQRRNPLKLNVELFSQSATLADAAVLVPDQEVEWKITNAGTAAVDITLLFIDSECAIVSAYPQAGQLVDNRLAPGESMSLGAMVRGNTLGAEYLVAIAARAQGPQRDFRWLAEPSLDAAKTLASAVRGGDDVLQSPFGRLLRYAVYNDQLAAGATRGLASTDAHDCYLTLRAWVVKPN